MLAPPIRAAAACTESPSLSANQCDNRKWASRSAQPLYPIPRQASSSELGGNNPSTHQDPTSKISPRSSHPVGSTVSVCGSFISLHPLPLTKNIGQSSQIFPPPQVCKLEGSATVLSDEEGGYPLLWGQAGPGIRALVPPGCMERESVKTDGLKKAAGTEGNGLCSTDFHLFRLAFTGEGKASFSRMCLGINKY